MLKGLHSGVCPGEGDCPDTYGGGASPLGQMAHMICCIGRHCRLATAAAYAIYAECRGRRCTVYIVSKPKIQSGEKEGERLTYVACTCSIERS